MSAETTTAGALPLARTADSAPPRRTIYTCPMHPEVEQDHRGNCPQCGMTLEPKSKPPVRTATNTPSCAT